jgi:hypothetical protein
MHPKIRQLRKISDKNTYYIGAQMFMIMGLALSRIQNISGNNKKA